MDSRWLGVIVLIIIVALGGWYIYAHPTRATAPTVPTTTGTETASSTAATVPTPVTVAYTDQGFSPKSVSIVEGQTVIWINQSSKQLWVASAAHPTHTAYDGTSKTDHCVAGYAGETPFDECQAVAAGASYSFTFTKAGSWKYHNHASATDTGTVVVTPAAGAAAGASASASTSVNVNVR